MEGNDTAREKVQVKAGGDMQITKELTAEEGNSVLVVRLNPGENDDGPMYVTAAWKNPDIANFKKADKADDVRELKMDEG